MRFLIVFKGLRNGPSGLWSIWICGHGRDLDFGVYVSVVTRPKEGIKFRFKETEEINHIYWSLSMPLWRLRGTDRNNHYSCTVIRLIHQVGPSFCLISSNICSRKLRLFFFFFLSTEHYLQVAGQKKIHNYTCQPRGLACKLYEPGPSKLHVSRDFNCFFFYSPPLNLCLHWMNHSGR